MIISVPDPHPGRCLNFRNGARCLHYDRHDSRCVFPKETSIYDDWKSAGHGYTIREPEPWKSPLDEPTEDLVALVRRKIAERGFGIREGQAAFNALYELSPALAQRIRGDHSTLDPFYRDENLPAFFRWLEDVS